jgi:hypothetical protein
MLIRSHNDVSAIDISISVIRWLGFASFRVVEIGLISLSWEKRDGLFTLVLLKFYLEYDGQN